MQDTESAKEKVDEIVAETLRVDRDTFDDETLFGPDGLGAESLDVVEIAERVDEELGIHIPDGELEEIDGVGELKTYVVGQLG